MSFGKITRDPADTAFSNYLRKLIGHCEICRKTEGLEVSHFYGRRNEATRFDPENADVICNYHHRRFHENPSDYQEWKLKKMGQARYDALRIRSNTYKKKDRKFEAFKFNEMLKHLDEDGQ